MRTDSGVKSLIDGSLCKSCHLPQTRERVFLSTKQKVVRKKKKVNIKPLDSDRSGDDDLP
jgi:site-specific DNA-cytosine methylase